MTLHSNSLGPILLIDSRLSSGLLEAQQVDIARSCAPELVGSLSHEDGELPLSNY